MQRKRGFTLIELLGVIIVIGIIALIAVPIVMNIVGKARKASFQRSVEGLIKSVEIDYSEDSFLAPRVYFYEKGTLTLLTVEGKVRDEKIGIHGKIDGNGFLYVDGEGNISIENLCNKNYCANGEEENIEVKPNPDGEIPEINKDFPVITLNGNKIVYVEIGGVYKEEGAIAKTIGGKELEYTKEIKYNNEIVEEIETTREGEYIITYSTENEGKKVSATRTVVVLEMKPVITMTEPSESYVKEQEILITVSGIRPNKVERFRVEIKKNGTVITSEEVEGLTKRITLNESGSYEVTVSATDNNGHINEVSKTYRISNSKPVITVNPERVTLEASEVVGYNVLSGVSATDEIDGEIESSKIIATGNLSATPGTYTITYQVTNSIGNTSTATRTVIVEEKGLPDAGNEGEVVTDPEENERYSGSNPNNWVCFGKSDIKNPEECDTNHKWRIIGIFDGKMKIMTNYYYSTTGRWDNTQTGSSNWENAQLNQELNGSSFYSNNVYIDTTHRGYIVNATWGTGGPAVSSTYTFQSFKDGEKNSTSRRYIGLMSVADVGYAGSDCTLATDMTLSGATPMEPNACMSNNWMNGANPAWTITADRDSKNIVFYAGSTIYAKSSYEPNGVRPAVYLNNDVEIISGTGTEDSPYILGKKSEDSILNFSSISSNNKWIKPINVTATAIDANGIKNFTYEVIKDGVSEGIKTITLTGKQGTVTIPLKEDGEYVIKLNVTNQNGKSSTLTSGTYKIDTVKPTITFENVTIKDVEAANYNLMTGVTASDNHGTPTVTTTGNLSTIPGTYTITYQATDEAGNIETKTRTIIVEGSGCTVSTEIVGGKSVTGCFRKDASENIRYTGGNPNNYVCFGNSGITDPSKCDANHKWRIIGVDSQGRMKLMTDYYYSESKAWDTYRNPNWGKGTSLRAELNGSSFYSNNTYIDTVHRDYIINSEWKTGSPSGSPSLLQQFEASEGSSRVSDYVGLMSVVDFGYAGSTCTLSTNMTETNNACMINNWIGYAKDQWTITYNKEAWQYNTAVAWSVSTEGHMGSNMVGNVLGVRPVVYLDSTVKIKAGTGTAGDPYILEKALTGKELAEKDNLPDLAGLKRYRGYDPNNWVCFGSASITNPGSCDEKHKWRIIGVDSEGKMKIRTNYYYSESKVWDTNNNNNWSNASLKTELNGSSFYSNNTYINATHRGYVANATWYTGGPVIPSTSTPVSTSTLQLFKDGEKSSRTTGYIGLMSATDVGYASSNSGCTEATDITYYGSFSSATGPQGNACMHDNWINASKTEWTITQDENNTNQAFTSDNIYINAVGPNIEYGVRPALYLDSSVKIIGGEGTETNPYVLTKW